jgi:hypothetical protein
MQEVDRKDRGCLGPKELHQVGPERRGAGAMPTARRISHTVDGAATTQVNYPQSSIRAAQVP